MKRGKKLFTYLLILVMLLANTVTGVERLDRKRTAVGGRFAGSKRRGCGQQL